MSNDPLKRHPHHEITALISLEAIDEAIAGDDVALALVVIEGRETGRRIKLGERPLVAGREPHLDIFVADGGVSRRHCLCTVIDGKVVIDDLGSTNGTFIDDLRIGTRATLPVGSLLRLGQHVFRCERWSRRDLERAEGEYRDLERASSYVRSLLPPPVSEGPAHIEWLLQPSARLGGDAFGYGPLDDHTIAFYLFDVSGHGMSAAMLSVSVLNVLRERALPNTDLRDPVQVLSTLNAMFQMERHDDQYFTIWYGVYDTRDRSLTYATAGHHPAYLVPAERSHAQALKTTGPVIGAASEPRFHAARTDVAPASRLYVFSDGVFEIRTERGYGRLEDFLPLLVRPMDAAGSECGRLYEEVTSSCPPGPLDDDFSLLVVTFP